jgi:hypothetical protein
MIKMMMAIGFTESVQDLPTALARSVKLGRRRAPARSDG